MIDGRRVTRGLPCIIIYYPLVSVRASADGNGCTLNANNVFWRGFSRNRVEEVLRILGLKLF